MFITKKHLSRRTVLRGHGRDRRAAVPRRDGAGAAPRWRKTAAGEQSGCVAIEMVHGAAGSTAFGVEEEPVVAGGGRARLRSVADAACSRSSRSATTSPSSATPTCATPRRSTPPEIGGDHFRSSAVFLTQAHPKQTQGSDVCVGTSLDQIYAQQFGQDTPIPSMQLCIENVDQAGGCSYGYSCVYTDSISWASPTEPLPMIRDPRVGVRSAVRRRRHAGGARGAPPQDDRSILDWVTDVGRAAEARRSAPPIARGSTTTSTTSARSSAASRRSRRTTRSGEPRELPGAPIGVPDSFDEHVKLMFDLQALAFAVGHHARVRVQARPRRLEPRLSRRAASRPAFHSGVAPRRARGSHPRLREDQQATTSAWCRTSSRS